MAMPKGSNPYTRFRDEVRRWAHGVIYPQTRHCVRYSADHVNKGIGVNVRPLARYVEAANTLGWDVKLSWSDESGLTATYVKRAKTAPYEII